LAPCRDDVVWTLREPRTLHPEELHLARAPNVVREHISEGRHLDVCEADLAPDVVYGWFRIGEAECESRGRDDARRKGENAGDARDVHFVPDSFSTLIVAAAVPRIRSIEGNPCIKVGRATPRGKVARRSRNVKDGSRRATRRTRTSASKRTRGGDCFL